MVIDPEAVPLADDDCAAGEPPQPTTKIATTSPISRRFIF